MNLVKRFLIEDEYIDRYDGSWLRINTSMMRLYPDRGVGSVMIANATGFDVGRALDHTDLQFFR